MHKILATLVFATLPLITFAAEYKIDPDHSTVGFTVRHIVTKVNGRFDKFSGTFVYDEKDNKAWKADATIETGSINTNNAKRDGHLKSKDFFDVDNAKHPEYKTIKFVSTKVTDAKGKTAKLHGKLTLHGVTKDVVLDLEDLGVTKDPWGNVIASFTATTKISRKDYGITWNQAIETGGVLVGDEVQINLEIAGLEQAPAAPAAKSEEKKPDEKKADAKKK
jgi:polyisoprenoid-binding protein YceI